MKKLVTKKKRAKKKSARKVTVYVSPAFPQFPTCSPVLAMCATAFFDPSLSLNQAAKLTKKIRVPKGS